MNEVTGKTARDNKEITSTFMAVGLEDSENVVTPQRSINIAEKEKEEDAASRECKRMKRKPVDLKLQMKSLNGMSFDFFQKMDAPQVYSHQPTVISTLTRPANELETAATELQKAYRSYRTRRKLADCAVVVEEFWWRDVDYGALMVGSSFDSHKSETAVARWARASTMAAKLGKGLCKDEKAQKLALRHWLEAIDPRHRYGHNLHLYYNVWFSSSSCQPFFYWLDVGDGKEVNLQECPRMELHHQCIKYLGTKEKEAYEVIVDSGNLLYKQSKKPVETAEGEKWIFVLSASRTMYVGKKHKAFFHHSSFLAGGAAIAAGRLVAHNGVLEAIWSYSGHYRLTEESFSWFLSFLEQQGVDLTIVEKCPMDDDIPPTKVNEEKITKVDRESREMCSTTTTKNVVLTNSVEHSLIGSEEHVKGRLILNALTATTTMITNDNRKQSFVKDNTLQRTNNFSSNESKISNCFNRDASATITSAKTAVADGNQEQEVPQTRKWATGAGPRIRCVREYPPELLLRALQQVNLSPRTKLGGAPPNGPIPSPRPSSKIHLSPRLACLGLPSPTLHVSNAKQDK